MNNDLYIKFYEIIISLENEAAMFIKINENFLKEILKFIQTDDGVEMLRTFFDQNKKTIDSHKFLDVKSFKHGLIVGTNLDDATKRIDELKDVENFSSKKENKFFLEAADNYNRELIEIVNKIDTIVDMFFTNFYIMKHRKKNKFFWSNYKKELDEMSVDIELIKGDMEILKDLRKIRNVYQHNNGNIDDQFCSHFNTNVEGLDIAKLQVGADKVSLFFVSLLDLFDKLLNGDDKFNFLTVLQNCSNLRRIKEEYYIFSKKQ